MLDEEVTFNFTQIYGSLLNHNNNNPTEKVLVLGRPFGISVVCLSVCLSVYLSLTTLTDCHGFCMSFPYSYADRAYMIRGFPFLTPLKIQNNGRTVFSFLFTT